MYAANLQQVYSNNPNGKPFKSWVICVHKEAGSIKESYIKNQHRKIDPTLSEQNVNYSEITTTKGKHKLWEKFNISNKHHPIFLISNKYPDICTKNDKVLIIEWGNWTDTEQFKEDVMSLVHMFNSQDFTDMIIDAYDKSNWNGVIEYIKNNGLSLIGVGVSIISAVI